jgi:hypothetical protein
MKNRMPDEKYTDFKERWNFEKNKMTESKGLDTIMGIPAVRKGARLLKEKD